MVGTRKAIHLVMSPAPLLLYFTNLSSKVIAFQFFVTCAIAWQVTWFQLNVHSSFCYYWLYTMFHTAYTYVQTCFQWQSWKRLARIPLQNYGELCVLISKPFNLIIKSFIETTNAVRVQSVRCGHLLQYEKTIFSILKWSNRQFSNSLRQAL